MTMVMSMPGVYPSNAPMCPPLPIDFLVNNNGTISNNNNTNSGNCCAWECHTVANANDHPFKARVNGQEDRLCLTTDDRYTMPDNTSNSHRLNIDVNSRHVTAFGSYKRKLESDAEEIRPTPKRISPYLNTPKQRKEDRRKVLKLSANKLKILDDPEKCLLRSVLIRNTVRNLQQEILTEKAKRYRTDFSNIRPSQTCNYTPTFHDETLVSPPMPFIFDDPPLLETEADKVMDYVTEALVTELNDSSTFLQQADASAVSRAFESDFIANSCEMLFMQEIDTVFNSLVCVLGES